jgi:hypothetical protein
MRRVANPLMTWSLVKPGLFGMLICCLPLFPATGLQEKPGPTPRPGSEYTGAYTFLRDGEFVQITVEDQGRVSGFISRYGDLESDKGAYLDHFFKSGKLEGNRLSFSTEIVHGVSFEFVGTIGRGGTTKPEEEGYYVIEGKLTEISNASGGKGNSKERGVTLKSFAKKADGAVPAAPSRQ